VKTPANAGSLLAAATSALVALAPWPPRPIQGKMLIAISELRRLRRNSVRYPVNAGLNVLIPASSRIFKEVRWRRLPISSQRLNEWR
jgi:hypothetical protein